MEIDVKPNSLDMGMEAHLFTAAYINDIETK